METNTYVPINPERQPLTIEKLRTFKGFENIEQERAQQIVDAIQHLAAIAHQWYIERKAQQASENGNDMQLKKAA